MPTTLTLKNIPDEVYERLKASAGAHRRSINSEVLVCLEAQLLPNRFPVSDRLARARMLRKTPAPKAFTTRDTDAFKRGGRP